VSKEYRAIIAMPINALPTRQISQSNSYLGDELTRDWRLRKLLGDELMC